MTSNWIVYVCLAIGLSSALVGGVFQAFSDFVMRGLLLAEPAGGIESMQHINRTVFRSVFLTTFVALVPVTVALALYAAFRVTGTAQALIIAAAVIYVVSVFLVTGFGNVPMNQRLDGLGYTTSEAATYWVTYGRVWTWLNHVRTVGCVGTAICLLLAATTLAGARPPTSDATVSRVD